MASMRAFQELQLMKRMRQYVFAHMERGGQRGNADATSVVELDEGEKFPVEEPTSVDHRFSLRGVNHSLFRCECALATHPKRIC